jgi:hypothetical protein
MKEEQAMVRALNWKDVLVAAGRKQQAEQQHL